MRRILPVLDVVTSAVALVGLLPIAGGLPSVASPESSLSDLIWLVVNLAGALLLMAGGARLLLPKVPAPHFIFGYAALVATLGALRLQLMGFRRMAVAWLLLALCVAALLLLLRHALLWAAVGSIWCALLLGLWSVGGIISYFAASSPRLPVFLLFQIVALVLTLILLIFHVRYRTASVTGPFDLEGSGFRVNPQE